MAIPRKQPRSRACATLLGHTSRGGAIQRERKNDSSVPTLEAQRQLELERELSMARDIQQGLLLEAVPRLPGWEMSAVSLPARDLGGDLYDFLKLEQGAHGIMIGDVSGKGLPAALRMAVARTVFRHAARKNMIPALTLAEVNREVLSDIPQGMVTMLYAALDLRSGAIRIANAGHNYPIVINGAVSEVELTGLPLGVDSESDYVEIVKQLKHGDTIFFFTDGVVEATNAQGEMYGDERLQTLLSEHAGMRPRTLVARLLQDLRAWSGAAQADDITLVVVRRRSAHVGDELRMVAEDVLGVERARALWTELVLPVGGVGANEWAAAIPEIVRLVQEQHGRGLARELHGQLRLVLEEYR